MDESVSCIKHSVFPKPFMYSHSLLSPVDVGTWRGQFLPIISQYRLPQEPPVSAFRSPQSLPSAVSVPPRGTSICQGWRHSAVRLTFLKHLYPVPLRCCHLASSGPAQPLPGLRRMGLCSVWQMSLLSAESPAFCLYSHHIKNLQRNLIKDSRLSKSENQAGSIFW